jgi:thymidylate kinase
MIDRRVPCRSSLPAFVVLEGVDRSGKNTVARLLADELGGRGRSVRVFTTPDRDTICGGLAGLYLRTHYKELLPTGKFRGAREDAVVIQSLMLASRYKVASRVVAAREAGEVAVCVRWWPSAELYGTLADNLPAGLFAGACSFLPEPDVYALLDVDSGEVAGRLDPAERYEEDPALQDRLARAYREMWVEKGKDDPRWVVLAAGKSPEDRVDLLVGYLST